MREIPHINAFRRANEAVEIAAEGALPPTVAAAELLQVFSPRVICASFCKLFRLSTPDFSYYLNRFLRYIRESFTSPMKSGFHGECPGRRLNACSRAGPFRLRAAAADTPSSRYSPHTASASDRHCN